LPTANDLVKQAIKVVYRASSALGWCINHHKGLGLDAVDFSGHSLRSGFLTSAARCGASVFKMRPANTGLMHCNRHHSKISSARPVNAS
jgi:hypothetical protein